MSGKWVEVLGADGNTQLVWQEDPVDPVTGQPGVPIEFDPSLLDHYSAVEPTGTGKPGVPIEFDPARLYHYSAVEPTRKDPASMTPAKAPSEGDTVTGIRYNPETNRMEKATLPYNDTRLSGAGEVDQPGAKSASVSDLGLVSDPMFDKKPPVTEIPQFPSFVMPSFVMPEWPTFIIPELPTYPTAPTQAAAQASVTPKTSGTDRNKIRKLTLLSDQNKSVSTEKLGNTSTGAGKKRLLG